ncbi:hypothetical protein RhiirC2_797775 [Rhizophagus irregularis]|uniref:Uncharacterized protein n=1 Tax=Rhizophagus irregularis TaxID=588596 RepID=A0A2N1M7I5_9GLOM|nr:hypothetical protein RhiirC2_797775 [Rhizophagus irregularis]
MSIENTFLELDFGLKILASRVLWDSEFWLLDSLGYWKKKIEQIERIKWISVELSSQSGQTGDTRIEQISIDPFSQSGDTTGLI